MKTKFLKYSVLVIAAMTLSVLVKAQDSYSKMYSNYDNHTKDAHGNIIDRVKTYNNGKEYSFTLVNDKITNLYINETMRRFRQLNMLNMMRSLRRL